MHDIYLSCLLQTEVSSMLCILFVNWMCDGASVFVVVVVAVCFSCYFSSLHFHFEFYVFFFFVFFCNFILQNNIFWFPVYSTNAWVEGCSSPSLCRRIGSGRVSTVWLLHLASIEPELQPKTPSWEHHCNSGIKLTTIICSSVAGFHCSHIVVWKHAVVVVATAVAVRSYTLTIR